MTIQQNRSSRDPLSLEAQAEIARDDGVFEGALEHVRERANGEIEGVFGPGSMTWLIGREPAILLGGLRALVLQIAHPAVAAGVARSSVFQKDLLGRARRTFTSTYEMLFGDLPTAMRAARRVHKIHNHVRGELETPGQGYRANDPALLKWVWATLVDTAILSYETFLRPLTSEEKRRYYDESRLFAALMGIPPSSLPASLEAFHDYYQAMLDSPTLLAGETTCGIAFALFNSPYNRLTKLDKVLTSGLLPPRFQDVCGLSWGERERQRYRRLVRALRSLFGLVPGRWRAVPAYHQAEARVARAYQRSPSLYASVIEHCEARNLKIPLTLKSHTMLKGTNGP
jgi:uncharacterized protein (DUF2236 family)